MHEFSLLFSCAMKVKRVKSFKSFFLRRMAARKSRGESSRADRWTFYFGFRFCFFRAFFRVVVCLHVVFRFFWSSVIVFLWCVFRTSSIWWGSHPGCKGKGSKRGKGPTAEPEPESQKGEDRGISRHKKVPKKQEWHPGAAVGLLITRSKSSLIWKGHEFFAPGRHV